MYIPGVGTLCPEIAWKKTIIDTVFPFVRQQLKNLRLHLYLLTDEEQDIVDEYAHNFAEYEKNWKSELFRFPKTPKGFEQILLD
jgi:hypothetical protein